MMFGWNNQVCSGTLSWRVQDYLNKRTYFQHNNNMDTCIWLGVDLGIDTTKYVLKMIDLQVENILTILD